MHQLPILYAALLGSAASLAVHATATAAACQAQSGATPPRVVELYTSEGCSSCPPADRWLSTLKGRSDVLALSFHVTYWDKLGWPDRFASSEFTQRQYAQARRDGSAQVYTPQVVVQGQDWREWPRLPPVPAAGLLPTLSLARQGDGVEAVVQPSAGQRGTWSGYWAVLEDNHASAVKAGENSGETLRHDHVVRLLRRLPTWDAAVPQRLQLQVSRGVPEHPRSVVLVVTDGATQRPLQALRLDC